MAEPGHGNYIRAASTTEPQRGLPLLPLRRWGNYGATRAQGARMGHRRGQPVWVGETQLFSPFHIRYRERIRPQQLGSGSGSRSPCGGLWRLAMVSHREAIDGMLTLPCVQRMEQLRE